MKLTNLVFISALGLLAALGCTGLRHHSAMKTERALADAGFEMELAGSAKRAAQIEARAQHRLTQTRVEGEIRYIYADAEFCSCIYVGTEESYHRYKDLKRKKNENFSTSNPLGPGSSSSRASGGGSSSPWW